MMPYKHEIGDAVNLTFKITNNGVGVTGLTPVVAVQRISDSQWLDDAKTAWQAGYNDIALTELDATNLPGIYGTDVTQFGGAVEKWRVYYKNTGTYAGIDIEIHEFMLATWAVATRTLTAGTNIVLAKGTGVTGFNDLSAAQVNTECDTALADYDPPTRTEATADKDAIIVQVDANETKIDTLLTRATELRLAELDPANIPTDIANVKGDTSAILDDTGTSGVVIPQAQADKVWDTVTRAITDKAGFSLAADQSGVTVGTVNALGTQAKADVNTEVDSALNTAIPGSPTADSINQRVKAIDDALTVTVYSVVADANNSTLQFKTNLPNIDTNNAYQNGWVRFTSGALADLPPRRVSTYDKTTKILVFTSNFPVAPATDDTFIMMVGSVAD